MADVVEPTPSPSGAASGSTSASEIPREPSNVTTNSASTGLPSNVAAALACFPLIGGVIFWLLETRDSFVRFYAMQSIIFGSAWLLFNILSWILLGILGSIPGIGGFLAMLWNFVAAVVHLGFFIIMVVAMIKAFSGTRWDIPYIGPIARKQVGET